MSIKELAIHFAMPARTVYYTVNNTPSIRQQKQGRRKVVNVADFAKACGKELPGLQPDVTPNAPQTSKLQAETGIAALQKSLQVLQNEHAIEKEKMLALQQVNTILKDDRDSFRNLYQTEKSEKETLWQQYAIVQHNHHNEIKRSLRRYYLSLCAVAVCITLLLVLNSGQIAALLGF